MHVLRQHSEKSCVKYEHGIYRMRQKESGVNGREKEKKCGAVTMEEAHYWCHIATKTTRQTCISSVKLNFPYILKALYVLPALSILTPSAFSLPLFLWWCVCVCVCLLDGACICTWFLVIAFSQWWRHRCALCSLLSIHYHKIDRNNKHDAI